MTRAAPGKARPTRDATADVAVRLTDWIASAQYPLHSRLPPERELATILQLPRGRIRGALQILEDEGRIWRRVGMGTFVGGSPRLVGPHRTAMVGLTSLTDILEARSLVEPVVARLAAERAGSREVAMIEGYAASAGRARSWAEWEKWDELLHRAIAEASGNGLLIGIIDQLLRIKTDPRWTIERAAVFDPVLAARYGREHRAVVARVVGGDGEGAEAMMRRHMLGLSLTIGPAVARTGRVAPQAGLRAAGA